MQRMTCWFEENTDTLFLTGGRRRSAGHIHDWNRFRSIPEDGQATGCEPAARGEVPSGEKSPRVRDPLRLLTYWGWNNCPQYASERPGASLLQRNFEIALEQARTRWDFEFVLRSAGALLRRAGVEGRYEFRGRCEISRAGRRLPTTKAVRESAPATCPAFSPPGLCAAIRSANGWW